MDAGKEISGVPEELVNFIKDGSKFIVAGHKEPDGDCVGSQLALRSVLLRLGKKAVVCSAGPFKRTELSGYAGHFVTVLSEKEIKDSKVIIIDCSGKERTGSLQDSLEGLPCAIIDHHVTGIHSPSTPETPVYTDINAPSCALLIFKLITALGLELTKKEATFLLFGVCTDTGFFRHLNEKNASTFEAVAQMMRYGASPKEIFHIMDGGKSLNSRILLGRLLSRIESYFDGRLLISHETLEEFNTFGFESWDSDNLNRLLLAVQGVEVVVIIRQEYVDNCTVSLRSIDKIDVSQIAASFGGGGHKNAAGLTMKGNVSHIRKVIIEAYKTIFS